MLTGLDNFQSGTLPAVPATTVYWLNHRNGAGIVEYCRLDNGQLWIVGGWHPVSQKAQAVKAIRRAIRLTSENQKCIGQQFLDLYTEPKK